MEWKYIEKLYMEVGGGRITNTVSKHFSKLKDGNIIQL